MSKFTLIALVLFIFTLLAGAVWYFTQSELAPGTDEQVSGDVMFSGTVLSVDNSAMMLDGPLQFVIATEIDTTETVSVPSMGINLCAAADSVRPAFAVAEGDVVSVRGLRAEDGSIFPCDSSEHYVRIVTKLDQQKENSLLDSNIFSDAEAIEMYYQSGPLGYVAVVNEDVPGKVFGRKLYVTSEYESFQGRDSGEAPAGIDVYLFSNPTALAPAEWVASPNNPFSNLMITEENPVLRSLSGRTFYEYERDGLYRAKVYVTAIGPEILFVTAEFMAETDRTQVDALRMLETLRSGQIEIN